MVSSLHHDLLRTQVLFYRHSVEHLVPCFDQKKVTLGMYFGHEKALPLP